MTVHDADQLAAMKFGVGQPVRRSEDPVLVRGEGCYTDDINVPGQLHAAMALSQVPHGVIRRIDIETAKGMPGVVAVITGEDLQKAGYGTLDCGVAASNRDGTPLHKTPRPALALDRVRFVGEPIACVIAETAGRGPRRGRGGRDRDRALARGHRRARGRGRWRAAPA